LHAAERLRALAPDPEEVEEGAVYLEAKLYTRYCYTERAATSAPRWQASRPALALWSNTWPRRTL
jgi:hypothetical protein